MADNWISEVKRSKSLCSLAHKKLQHYSFDKWLCSPGRMFSLRIWFTFVGLKPKSF